MPYPNISQVSHFFYTLDELWKTELIENTDGIECSLENKGRIVRHKWFQNSPEEFWFSMHEGSRCDLVDWTQMFESETKEELFDYLKKVTTRYLENKTRVTKKWLFFGSEKLQYFKNDKWHDLRSPI